MAARQRKGHVISEWGGVLSGLVLILIGRTLETPQNYWLFGMGITTIIVDLYFIETWSKKR